MKTTVTTRYMRWVLTGILLLLVFAVITGCDSEPTEFDDYEPDPVLTAFIETDKPMDWVRLEWVGGFYDYYDREQLGIVGADIVVFPVRQIDMSPADSSGIAVYFTDDPEIPGVYRAVNPEAHQPLGGWRYRIEVWHEDLPDTIHAETTAPGAHELFCTNYPQILPPQSDTLTFNRNDPVMEFSWTASDSCGGYIFQTECLVPRDSLAELDPDWDPNDEDDEIEPEDMNRFFITIARWDQLTQDWPWLVFEFRGLHRMEIRAASPDYYRYVFTSMYLGDPSSDVRVETNVVNGIGIFGATYTHTMYLNMVPVED